MDYFERTFIHLPEYRIIICRQCYFAVVPLQTLPHLKQHHPSIPPPRAKELAIYIQQLPNLAITQDQIQYPYQDSPPIPGLPVFKDGFECIWQIEAEEQCGYICQRVKHIQRHCTQKHGWQNNQKRGRATKEGREYAQANKKWKEGVTYQRFFEYAQWKKYFRVQELGQEQEGQPISLRAEELVQRGEAFLEEWDREAREEKSKAVIGENSNRYQTTPWLDTIRWESHLKGFEKEAIVETMKPARDETSEGDKRRNYRSGQVEPLHNKEREEDKGLAEACKATQRLIRKAFKVCQGDDIPRAAMKYVNRREGGESNNERPFYARQKVKTIRDYSIVWIKIMRYLWRTSQREESQRPAYALTAAQKKYLGRMIAKARLQEDRHTYQNNQERQDQQDEIEESCLKFWISMLDHELRGDDYKSGIVSGLAVLGLDTEHKGWSSAENFTPKLSALVTVAKAIVVYTAYSYHSKEMKGLIEDGMDEKEAEEEALSVFEIVKDLVHKFMTLTEFGGTYNPMDFILSMRTYGLKIRYTSKADARVSWQQGGRISIDKISFTLEDIRTVTHGLNEVARERMMKELLIGEDGGSKTSMIPKLDLEELFDNAADMSEGWSFLSDTRNNWEVNGWKWMWSRMFKEDKVGKQFIKKHAQEKKDIG